MPDSWDPALYETFAAERRQPFDDLLALVEAHPGGRAVDLGCGTGALTAELHRATRAASTTGIDSSPAMLARAGEHVGGGLSFALGDAASFGATGLDLVFANASLQWVPDHPALLPRLVGALAPGGQLAFQVPANYDHPSHVVARELADEDRWRNAFGGAPPADRGSTVLTPERYAELLDGLGVSDLHVRLQVYGHHLASADSVVDWVRGTLLTPYQAALREAEYRRFVDEYRVRLLQALGPARPYFYAFKRILVRARAAAG